MNKYSSIDHYIADQPNEKIRSELNQIRATIRKSAPLAQEVISYGMPAFKQNGMLAYFAAFKDHLSFFPGASGVEVFKDHLTAYKTSKGTIQFSFQQTVPLELIAEIVKFRVQENIEKLEMKKRK
ncbi:MAG: iron chaperone [Prolixibacteraceae bacterium]